MTTISVPTWVIAIVLVVWSGSWIVAACVAIGRYRMEMEDRRAGRPS